ncbi:MAG: hypothetical protein EXQ99_08545 [Alphaproteobacteria bacterium]|nr:hypothetical protein [Alphaproteobacteria bacterium]
MANRSSTEHGRRLIGPMGFTLIVVLVALVAVSAVSLFNWRVDPYGLFGMNRNLFHFLNERLTKQGLINHAPPDAFPDGVVLGSSMATQIDPDLVHTTRLLNLAWSAGLPEEFLYFLQSYNSELGFVVIGIDLFMFDEAQNTFQQDNHFRRFDPWRTVENLVSLDVLRHSLRHLIWKREALPPFLTPLGARNGRALESAHRKEPHDHTEKVALYAKGFADFHFSERRLPILQAPRSWAEGACKPLVIYTNPVSPAVLAEFESPTLATALARFRAELRREFPDLIDLSNGPYSAARNFWAHDPVHVYPSVAARLFDEALWPALEARKASLAASDCRR